MPAYRLPFKLLSASGEISNRYILGTPISTMDTADIYFNLRQVSPAVCARLPVRGKIAGFVSGSSLDGTEIFATAHKSRAPVKSVKSTAERGVEFIFFRPLEPKLNVK